MSKSWKYSENRNSIIIEPPRQRNRITGHRLASVLGLNEYQSPFGAWAEITKLVKLPYEETKYTLFGKAVEPKLIRYVAERFPNVVSIEEYYGNIYKEYQYNNFKDISNVYGGVIDAVATKPDGKTINMICECKTSSHPEAWKDGNVPVEYLLQGALYSYMMRLDRVLFVCTFPKDIDYANPENYKVDETNTILVVKKLEDMIFQIGNELLNIEGVMQKAEEWWNTYVETGISPRFDEVKDKEYLDIIRATDEVQDNELLDVCNKAYDLSLKIEATKVSSGIVEMEKQLKLLEASIKNEMTNKGSSKCGHYKLSRTIKKQFNENAFAENEPKVYESYLEEVESFRLTKVKDEGEE